MNIKSDSVDFVDVKHQKPKRTKTIQEGLFWLIVLGIGGLLMWVALMSPEVKGLIAFFVFFIGLNRVDASIDYFRGVDDNKSVSKKDII
jgi:hypothetical protein